MEFDICSLELEYVNQLHNSKICNIRIKEVILIGSWALHESIISHPLELQLIITSLDTEV